MSFYLKTEIQDLKKWNMFVKKKWNMYYSTLKTDFSNFFGVRVVKKKNSLTKISKKKYY